MMLQASSFVKRLGFLAFFCLAPGCVNKSVDVAQNQTPSDGGGSDISPDPATISDRVLAVSGQVTDVENGQPIAGALVMTEPPIGQIRTNSTGMYVFVGESYPDLHPQQLYRISASHDNYTLNFAQVLMQPGHNRNVDIQLERAMASYYLVVNKTTLNLTDAMPAETLLINIDTQSDDMAAYNATVDINARSWLSVDPASGTISGTPRPLDVIVMPGNLESGTYHGQITITVPGDTKTLTVNFQHE
jgi:hypothetical protein